MNNTEQLNFEYWLKILYRRRKIFLIITLLTFIGGVIITFITPPQYRAESSIFFPVPSRPMLPGFMSNSNDDGGLGMGFAMFAQGARPSMQEFALSILKSRTINDMVLDKFGERLFPGRFKKRKRVQLREMMQKPIKIMMGSDNVIKITVDSSDPALSMEIANFYVDEFRKFSNKAVLTSSKNKRLHLTKQSKVVNNRLNNLEKELTAFENKKKVVDIDAETKAAIDNYSQLFMMSATVTGELHKAEEKLASLKFKLKKQAESFDATGVYPSIQDQPVIQDLMLSLSKKEMELLQARQFYTDEHPKIIALKKDVEDTRILINEKITGYMSGIKSNLVPRLVEVESEMLSLRAQSNAIKDLLHQKEEEMGKIPNIRLKYNRLNRQVTNTELVVTMIEQELEKARVEEARDDAEMQILDAALAPDFKSKPDVVYNLLLSLLFGMILGIMLSFYVEYSHRVMNNLKEP